MTFYEGCRQHPGHPINTESASGFPPRPLGCAFLLAYLLAFLAGRYLHQTYCYRLGLLADTDNLCDATFSAVFRDIENADQDKT